MVAEDTQGARGTGLTSKYSVNPGPYKRDKEASGRCLEGTRAAGNLTQQSMTQDGGVRPVSARARAGGEGGT